MANNNPLPYVGATMIYKAANAGQKINGLDDLVCFVTKVVNDRTVNVVVLPDGGGALVAYNGASVVPDADHATAKAGSVHWPSPRFA